MRRLLLVCAAMALMPWPAQLSAHDFNHAKDQALAAYPLPEQEKQALDKIPEAPRGALRGVLDSLKVWPVGEALNVCFKGGSQQLKQFFADTAKAWAEAANISFDFGAAPAFRACQALQPSQIRVAFERSGNWSLVGTDSMAVDVQKQTSLNIGDAASDDFASLRQDHLRGVILHELGHALGLQHEHQSPESGCEEEFDWKAIYDGLGGPPNNWSKAEVDLNLRRLVTSKRLRTTQYDPKSIMHYALPPWMFKSSEKSKCFVPENMALSDSDRTIIRTAYPASDTEQQRYLTASGEHIEAVLKEAGITQEQAKALAELAKGIVAQSHEALGFSIKIENLRKQEDSQENQTQTINGDNNIGVFQGIQDSTITINGGEKSK